MSHIHQSCNYLVLRAPRVARWRAFLNVIVLVCEALDEAFEMYRTVHHKYPFDNE